MKFSEIKEVRELVGHNWRDVVESISMEEDDFEVDLHRFIRMDKIDEIQQNEIGEDGYLMGCFNSWFLAEILDIDQDIIDEMQKKECLLLRLNVCSNPAPPMQCWMLMSIR